MNNHLWDEIGDTLFAIAMAAAIGLGVANLAVQVSKERAALGSGIAAPVGAVSTITPMGGPISGGAQES
jgi:hypothetical protein